MTGKTFWSPWLNCSYMLMLKRPLNCQWYPKIHRCMQNFGEAHTKVFRISLEIAYRFVTRSWHGGSVNRKTKPQLFYVPFMPSVHNTWKSLKRNEFIRFRNLKTAITIFIALRFCSKWKQLAIFTPKRYFEKQIESVIFVSRCYMYLRRTTVIAVWQIVLSFKNERSLTSFP